MPMAPDIGIAPSSDSAYLRRRKLYDFVNAGMMGTDVLQELLPGGSPLPYEKSLWDYKLELPLNPSHSKQLSTAEKNNLDAKFAEVVKDVVSFYNSYGGYLVIGVRDENRELVGFDGNFDCGDL